MRKSSSFSPKDKQAESYSNFKKNGSKPHDKDARPFKKKNYDGRGASAGAGKPAGRSKPYSGRVTDGDKPAHSFDKPTFGKERQGGSDHDRKPRKQFDKPFKGDDDRRPRKEFDKPYNRDNDRKPFGDRPKRSFDKPFNKDSRPGDKDTDRKPRKEFDKPFSRDKDRKPFGDRPKRSFDKPFNKDNRPGDKDTDRKPRKEFDKPFKRNDDRKPYSERAKDAFDKPAFNKDNGSKRGNDFRKPGHQADPRPFRNREKPAFAKKGFDKSSSEKEENKKEQPEARTFSDVVNDAFKKTPAKNKDVNNADNPGKREQFEDKVYGELEEGLNEDRPKKPYERKENKATGKKKHIHDHSEGRKKKYKDEEEDDIDEEDKEINQKDGPRLEMPLNKYIAHSGECSRRDAAELVRQGKVKVNGELILEPGYKVKHDDKVTLSGKKMTPQKGMVYILLNKPKGYITTNDDPQGRRTVMDLVTNSGADRLYPVGRLDRDTSGLLLITNDGDLTQKLSHPSFNIKKVYHVALDRPLTKADFEKIVAGVELEDGKAIVDEIAYLESKNELGLEIHSGKNRIVRRIFESLGYVVEKLDRMMYAGLTKKNLPRGKWRKLDEREIVLLKHFKS